VTQEFVVVWKADRDAGKIPGERGEGGPGKGRPGGGKGKGVPDPDRIMSRFDTDEDGAISKEEAIGPMERRFSQMDANEDGKVTAEELKTGMPGVRR